MARAEAPTHARAMTAAVLATLAGLILVVWSADRFVDGAAAIARHLGMPSLLIGMVIVGFGTSAPEMAVSVLAASAGNPGLALGNAYGSNIANIALILGVTALLSPIAVHSRVVRKELPILTGVTLLAIAQLLDGWVSRGDALVLLAVFSALMVWSIANGLRDAADALATQTAAELSAHPMTPARGWLLAIGGLLLLLAASRLLVWGAVEIATALGVSDLVIGLTVVAVGTSLPELAAAIAATRKGESDIALGNVIGSNLFNTLAVVGLAGAIAPIEAPPELVIRDASTMLVLTLALMAYCYRKRDAARITRTAGVTLLGGYLLYAAAIAGFLGIFR